MNTDKKLNFEELVKLWAQKRCEIFIDDIFEYSQNNLKGEEKKRVERHLQQCDNCRYAYNEFMAEMRAEPTPSIVERVKELASVIPKKLNLVEQLRSLKSGLSFPFDLVPVGATRGPELQKNVFSVGETVFISLETPAEGHLAVFNYDSQGKLRLVFPRKRGDVSLTRRGEEKRILLKVTGPIGKQWLKAIFFQKQLIMPDRIDLDDDSPGLTIIETFLDKIPTLKGDEWMEAEYEIDVIET